MSFCHCSAKKSGFFLCASAFLPRRSWPFIFEVVAPIITEIYGPLSVIMSFCHCSGKSPDFFFMRFCFFPTMK